MGLAVARALGRAGIARLGVLALLFWVGCSDCPKIVQHVILASPDPDLQPLVDACLSSTPSASEPKCGNDGGAFSTSVNGIQCGCLALCRRALQIIDQFKGSEELLRCYREPLSDAGTGVAIAVTYRPSTCP